MTIFKREIQSSGYKIGIEYYDDREYLKLFVGKYYKSSISMFLHGGKVKLCTNLAGKYMILHVIDAVDNLACSFDDSGESGKKSCAFNLQHDSDADTLRIMFCAETGETTELLDNLLIETLMISGKEYISGFIIKNVSYVLSRDAEE